jgi:hypothetical protein
MHSNWRAQPEQTSAGNAARDAERPDFPNEKSRPGRAARRQRPDTDTTHAKRDVSTPYTTVIVNSWAQFLGHLSQVRDWAFRGQFNAHQPLYSSLSRYFKTFRIDRKVWAAQEERILRIFKRKAHNYLSPVPDYGDHFQWLALMEHHGAPTRLLDFTWSPYVAAFFALESATGDSAVWAINPAKMMQHQDITPPRQAGSKHIDALDPRVGGNFKKHYLRGTKPFVWLGEPEVMNRRLIAQSGTFLMPSVLHLSIEDILARYSGSRDILLKFVLKTPVRETAMRELYSMNITHATLFPDLDGLARSMAYELEFHWAYNPHRVDEEDEVPESE